ncbi:MAG: hypothetical protein FWE54_00330 [Methanimicrococcus sp.]|nr:hypothetical protein [Methanimicrococcus sp.]
MEINQQQQHRLEINQQQQHRLEINQQQQHRLEINQQHQQIMIIAVHSDSVLRCAQTGIRNERSVLGAIRELKKRNTDFRSFYSKPERRFFQTLKDKFREKWRSLFLFS